MITLFQIVSENGNELLTPMDLADRFGDTARETGTHLRPELRDQPRLPGLCGPMWGGWLDARGESVYPSDDRDPTSEPLSYSPSKGPVAIMVIRYETWETYERMSR